MYAHVNGINLYYEIESNNNAAPYLLLIHGGPGVDHNYFKPEMSQLADSFQIIYYDHRGQGKSDRCSPANWNLEQWTSDANGLLDAIGVEKATILGNSFGGFIAQSMALKYPNKVDKLILSSTMGTLRTDRIVKAFKDLYNDAASQAAENFWHNPTNISAKEEYLRVCGPLYNTQPQNNVDRPAIIRNDDVLMHFYAPGAEGRNFNLLPQLKNIFLPTLILAGRNDPVSTIDDALDLKNSIANGVATLKIFENCGHGVQRDNATEALSVIRNFCLK
jgi:proline-specific peptidase